MSDWHDDWLDDVKTPRIFWRLFWFGGFVCGVFAFISLDGFHNTQALFLVLGCAMCTVIGTVIYAACAIPSMAYHSRKKTQELERRLAAIERKNEQDRSPKGDR